MPPAGEGRAALDAAVAAVLDAHVTVVVGPSDAGKTTLVAALASELASRGRVGVVDGDVGQSEIGPPTTVGLGRVRGRIVRLSDAEVIAFQFVGVTSPARDIRSVVDATRRMVERARAEGLERVLVDTSGLVLGWPGRELKGRKIEAVDPDLVLFLERGDECAPIVERFAGRSRPRVLRLAAPGRPGSRSQIARREHRVRGFDAYLRAARSAELARSLLELPRGSSETDVVGGVCGLDDGDGNTLALGLIEEISRDAVRVRAPLQPRAKVARLRVGRERPDGTLLASTPARRASAPAGDGRDGAA
jgi:polynucleotide 5'-kinase involved in rRNA processing